MMLRGVWTALVTPFRSGAVDADAFRRLVDLQVQGGAAGVVVCGSTGEAATLRLDEREILVRLAVAACQGSTTQVWVGTGTNATESTIELTRGAAELGAQGAMVVAPYYNKPTQEGLYRHFEAVAKSTSLPLIVYNVPGRTSVHIAPETVARLAGLGNYVAVKEASGSLDQASDIRARCGMTILSGDDSLTLPMMALGATGVISVVSNLLPSALREMVDAFAAGDLAAAQAWHFRLLPFFRAAFWETNPSPIKMLLHLDRGWMTPEVRLPLVPASDAVRPRLEAVLRDAAWREGRA